MHCLQSRATRWHYPNDDNRRGTEAKADPSALLRGQTDNRVAVEALSLPALRFLSVQSKMSNLRHKLLTANNLRHLNNWNIWPDCNLKNPCYDRRKKMFPTKEGRKLKVENYGAGILGRLFGMPFRQAQGPEPVEGFYPQFSTGKNGNAGAVDQAKSK
jgi:hypothetical protein